MKYWNPAFLERLLQVQSTDLEIRKLDSQIQILYQRSKEEDAELTRIRLEIGRVDADIESTESQNQMYGTTLDDIRTAIKGLMTTKSGMPKPRTRSSTEALKIEEEKLSALVEETSSQLGVLREEREHYFDRAEARAKTLEKDQEGPEAEIRKIQQQIRRLERQRDEEVKGIPPMLLKHYDRLRTSRSGIGLTVLRDGVCMVCRMHMPTAVVSRMSKGERVPVCPACGRMVARIEIVDLKPAEESGEPAAPKTSKGADRAPGATSSAPGEKRTRASGAKPRAGGAEGRGASKRSDATDAEGVSAGSKPMAGPKAAKKKMTAKPSAKKGTAKKVASTKETKPASSKKTRTAATADVAVEKTAAVKKGATKRDPEGAPREETKKAKSKTTPAKKSTKKADAKKRASKRSASTEQ